MEQQPKYREKVLIGLESAPPSFDVRSKVMGPGGANLQYITNETGAIVTIRGKGSGFIEPSTGHESVEPLHICVEHSKYDVLQAGRQLAFNLIETVQQEWSNIQQQQQHHQQTGDSQPQATVQAISVHTQLAGAQSVQPAPAQEAVLPTNSGALQLQLPVYNPPPSLAMPPPPIHMPQTQPIQVSVSSSGGTQTHPTAPSTGAAQPTQEAAAQPAIVQQAAGLQASDIQHQIQIQPQQVYVSQGGGVIQPATIIPQQQLQQASILAHQPQIITQSYPIQYVQASNGQMVVAAYPNIVRPVAADNNSTQQQQVMLVQYAPQRPLLQGRTATQSHTIPQIVQIVNPQTGQIQHVLQHIQPQIQMQQLALATSAGQGGAVVGGQVLMPLQQSGQQQQILTAQQGGQPIQFATQHQGMIIASQPHQVTVSQGSLQQQTERSSPQVVQQQVLRPGQGVKRRFDAGPAQSNQLPPNYQSIPPPQAMPPPALTLQTIRKGIGSEAVQQQQAIRSSQQQAQAQAAQTQAQVQAQAQAQQQQQQHLQQLLQQHHQQQQQAAVQQMLQQHQQQLQVVQQSSIDESQQIDDKQLQQQILQTDDWRLQQTQQQQQQRTQYVQIQAPNSPSSNDGNKIDQPKRGRPSQNGGGGDGMNENRSKVQMDLNKQQQQQQQASYAYQQQQQQSQQTKQQQMQSQYGAPADGYPAQAYQAQGYPPIYQQPPPASFQQQQPPQTYNSWLMPQQ